MTRWLRWLSDKLLLSAYSKARQHARYWGEIALEARIAGQWKEADRARAQMRYWLRQMKEIRGRKKE